MKIQLDAYAFFKWIFIISQFLSISLFTANAQVGCLYNNVVYRTSTGTNTIVGNLPIYQTPTIITVSGCPVPPNATVQYAAITAQSSPNTCAIPTAIPLLYNTGTLVSFSIRNCPIEDYLPSFFFITCTIVIIRLRKGYKNC